MILGPVVFSIAPMSLVSMQGSQKMRFASHDVLGAHPVLEFMGPDSATRSIEGVIYPEHFGGGAELSRLVEARKRGVPLPLIRGDFTPLGWFVIEDVQIKHESMNAAGVGREITFTVELRSVSTPPSDSAPSIFRLFG